MLPADIRDRHFAHRPQHAMRLPWRPWIHLPGLKTALTIVLLILAGATRSQLAGGEVRLIRKYRLGQAVVYVSKVATNSTVESDPPALKSFFPPMPTNLRLTQQSTVTVSKVQPGGGAEVEHRFDKFEIQIDLANLPEAMRETISQAQQEVSQQMVGKKLTAHYGADGRLLDFVGGDSLFHDFDAPVREPLLQMLRLFLEQMGGQSLYPDHPIRLNEEWAQSLDAEPSKDYPFQVHGNSTLHYAGKTRYQGVKAAIVDYHFHNTLTPAAAATRRGGALPQLEALGMHLDMQVTGRGQGRILVALNDGRVLQNHSSLHQTLNALMKGKEGFVAPAESSPRLEIQSDTEMDVEGNNP